MRESQAQTTLIAPEVTRVEDQGIREKMSIKEERPDPGKHSMSQKQQKLGWLKDNANPVIAVFTVIIAGIGGMQGFLFYKQLDAMRKDQRPWISVTLTPPAPISVGGPIGGILHLANFGKTPARGIVRAEFSVEKVQNGAEPKLDYPWGHLMFSTGMIVPNDSLQGFPIHMTRIGASGNTEMAPMLQSDIDDMNQMKVFYIVYGIVHYSDFFNIDHWTKFCQPILPIKATDASYTGEKCHDYNDVDGN